MRIALTGDVMLGRLVDRYVIQNRSVHPHALWGDVLPIMLSADCRLINLECVISKRGDEWHPTTKEFRFRADPRALDFLQAAQIDGVTLANNHVLDYGTDALLDCLKLRDARVAVVALTDNEPEWEATMTKPGVNYVTYNERGLVEPHRSRIVQVLSSVRRRAELVIISAHVGPNWGAPSRAMQALAHDLIDMGVDLYWGHSNHTPQAIEVYTGKAILYSTGDFIDDYMVDRDERNDLSFLFVLERETNGTTRVRLYPTCIEDFGVRLANEREWQFLKRTMQAKCRAFGTTIELKEQMGTISVQ